MLAKITVTVENESATNQEMVAAVALIASLGETPLKKLVVSVECEPEDAQIVADDFYEVLAKRAVGIEAKIKTVLENEVERRNVASVTPMDKVGWN